MRLALHSLVQKPGESLKRFIDRFSRVQRQIHDIFVIAVIATFHANVRDAEMHEKLSTRLVHTVAELYRLADKCARAEKEGAPTVTRPGSSRQVPELKLSRKARAVSCIVRSVAFWKLCHWGVCCCRIRSNNSPMYPGSDPVFVP